ncbi:hypothetical protein VTJ49DRAFT_7111 [Mycothermus thermophilus]|uniref:Uncharacterized protein n=1 Tax=Humicola insolens TaxID=85995 RepID=A0ABR3VKE9_HUMIN
MAFIIKTRGVERGWARRHFPAAVTFSLSHPSSPRGSQKVEPALSRESSQRLDPASLLPKQKSPLEPTQCPTRTADSSNQILLLKQSVRALKSSFGPSLVSPPFPRTTNQSPNRPLHCSSGRASERACPSPNNFHQINAHLQSSRRPSTSQSNKDCCPKLDVIRDIRRIAYFVSNQSRGASFRFTKRASTSLATVNNPEA